MWTCQQKKKEKEKDRSQILLEEFVKCLVVG
jgi:hypothetical protein